MAAKKTAAKGLAFSRHYTREGISPYEMFEYDYRTSMIKDPSGKIIFQMDNVEVPKHWSQIATDILAQKIFP
jgi:Class II vitamin B12-dependent ribonucleotide reductase.